MMTRSYTADDLPALLSKARSLTDEYMAGGDQAFIAYRRLLTFILRLTVMEADHGLAVRRFSGDPVKRLIASWEGPHVPLRLTNGAHLRFSIQAFLGETTKAPGVKVLKVAKEDFQYQLDVTGRDWMFRYEYEREHSSRHPPSHVHVRGEMKRDLMVLGTGKPLEKVHFPTGRVSVPAVVRLLVEQFGLKCGSPSHVWRPVLAQVEDDFFAIAHHAPSGPTS
jgi:hypothetical protein